MMRHPESLHVLLPMEERQFTKPRVCHIANAEKMIVNNWWSRGLIGQAYSRPLVKGRSRTRYYSPKGTTHLTVMRAPEFTDRCAS